LAGHLFATAQFIQFRLPGHVRFLRVPGIMRRTSARATLADCRGAQCR
jgi:hypothetical protein